MPWVPKTLYDVMVEALREQRRPVASVPSLAPTVTAPPVVTLPVAAAPTPPLPEPVAAACAEYAFGDVAEEGRNRQQAAALVAAGKSPADIIRAIRQGAPVEALFL